MGIIADQLNNHPKRDTFDQVELARCIEACQAAAAASSLCADACLVEPNVADMRRCIQTDLDCATICLATAQILSRPSPSGDVWRKMVETCVRSCMECAVECEKHLRSKHCMTCANACRACEMACQQLLTASA